jgi:hypothetical protein
MAVARLHGSVALFEARTHEPIAPPGEARGIETRDGTVAENQILRRLRLHPAADAVSVRVNVRARVAHLKAFSARQHRQRVRVLALRERQRYE